MDAYAAWVVDFMKEIRLDRFLLSPGTRWGGAIALQAALGTKGLEALVLLGTGARLRISPCDLRGDRRALPEFAPELCRMDDVDRPRPTCSARTSPRMSPPRGRDLPLRFPRVQNGFDVMNRLDAIRVPTLVIIATTTASPAKYGEYLAANIPGLCSRSIHAPATLAML